MFLSLKSAHLDPIQCMSMFSDYGGHSFQTLVVNMSSFCCILSDMTESKNKNNPKDKRLLREVSLTLLCKIVAIVCLGLLSFSSADRVNPDADSMSRLILSDGRAVSSPGDSTH